MGITLQQVTESLVHSGLVDDSGISDACNLVEQTGKEVTANQLVEQLVNSGLTTSFQGRIILEGNAPQLIFGNYTILNLIGEGGMGAVYKAIHRRMNRIVALKVIRKGLATSEFIMRFRREIQAAARLNHRNVIAAYDADECELGDFLVMEFVEGADLGEIVEQRGPLTANEVIDVTRQAAEALRYAHQQGIVHRDIKPANLMRDLNGVIKLADLGLARIVNQQTSEGENAEATQAGMAAGTVDYMPPEQAVDAASVDHRADIYSLGCTLFFLVTGKPPFSKGSLLDRVLAHRVEAPPSLSEAAEGISPELDAIFQKMVAKDPGDRFETATQLIEALDQLEGTDSKAGDSAAWIPGETTALIVESSRLQAAMIRKILNQVGIDDVHLAENAADALDKLATLPIGLALISLQLADTSGLALADRIRDELRWSDTAIVLMTSDDPDHAFHQSVVRLASTDCIGKPFGADQLIEVVDRLMEGQRGKSSELESLASRSVLVVDDSSVARRHVVETLKELGFIRISEAEDGQQAIERMQTEGYDLIVTDYNMPNVDGRQLVAWIRSENKQKDVPVIMVTTEFDPARLASVYQLGVSAITGKSFDYDLVRNIVIRLFLSRS